MNLQEFLVKMRELKDKGWTLHEEEFKQLDCIRLLKNGQCRCPLSAIAFEFYQQNLSNFYFLSHSDPLPLSNKDRLTILNAADGLSKPGSRGLRKQMREIFQ
jgi:hypothetical protein